MGNPTGIGVALRRKEDLRFLTGRGNYTADIKRPDQTAAVFVRSPHAHARIVSIDTAAARAMPGVVAVFTGEDLEGSGRRQLAVRLAGHGQRGGRHQGAGAPRAGAGQGPACRRPGRAGRCRDAHRGAQCRRSSRGGLRRAARCGRRARRAEARRARGLRRHPGQRLRRLGSGRSACDGCRVQEGGARRAHQPGEQPSGRQSDGVARGDRRVRPRPWTVHAVDQQPVSAHRQAADGQLRPQHPAAQAAGGVPRRGRRLRRQAVSLRRRGGGHLGGGPAGPAGEVGMRAQRGLPVGCPRPRSRHRGRDGAGRERQVPRPAGQDDRQHGRVPVHLRPQHSDQPVRPAARRRLHHACHLLRSEMRVHQHAAGGRLSRRRPSRSDVRPGAPGRCRGQRGGHRQSRDPPPQHDSRRCLPVPDAGDDAVRQRRSGRLPGQGSGYGRLEGLSQAQSGVGEPRQVPRHRPVHLHRGLRAGAVADRHPPGRARRPVRERDRARAPDRPRHRC